MANIRIHFNVIYSSYRAKTTLNIHERTMAFLDFNKGDNMKEKAINQQTAAKL